MRIQMQTAGSKKKEDWTEVSKEQLEEVKLPASFDKLKEQASYYYHGENISDYELVQTAVALGKMELPTDEENCDPRRTAWNAFELLVKDQATSKNSWSNTLYSEDVKYTFTKTESGRYQMHLIDSGNGKDADRKVRQLLEANKLIFDELQEFPEIATSLKFFKLDGRFDVILRKCGYELFYHKKDASYLEEDFFVRTKDYLVPVEVKATNGTAKSLRTLLRSDSYPDVKYGIGNIGYSDNIYTFPYFCAFLLKNYLKEVSIERESRG